MGIHRLHWHDLPPTTCQLGAVTIGNFDGVHVGHRVLLAELRKQARAVAGPAVALTFDPHPLQLLRPAQFQPLLTTPTDRGVLLQASGADEIVILHATPELLRLTADEFFTQVLIERLQARIIIEGENFGFGRNRGGNVTTLAEMCRQAGRELVVVPPLQLEGRTVSSSRVREALMTGNVREATRLLDRPYHLRGCVGTGQHRGQQLGFPTANLCQVSTLLPADGVYAVRVCHQDTLWPGAANIGPNPTFGEHERKIEVHLIGFHGDLVGQELTVYFIDRLRDTYPFAGVAELIAQLRKDVEQARQLADVPDHTPGSEEPCRNHP